MCPVAYRSRRWITFSGTVNTLSEEVPMKAVYCPYCGGQLGAANGYSPFMAIRVASAIE